MEAVPGYSVTNGIYDHKQLTGEVPYLSLCHLQSDLELLSLLEDYSVPFIYKLMVADVEAMDSVFCNKFTNGSPEVFLERCDSSVFETQQFIKQSEIMRKFSSRIISTSFFREFDRSTFTNIQMAYEDVLNRRFLEDSSFRSRVNVDLSKRMEMYKNMYRGIIDEMNGDQRNSFLARRTIRTMAQYLTLGRFISLNPNSIIINHPTTNNGMFNDRNKYKLENEEKVNHRRIPVFQMLKSVY